MSPTPSAAPIASGRLASPGASLLGPTPGSPTLPSPGASVQASPSPGPSLLPGTLISDDALLLVSAPVGAMPDPIEMTIATRGEDELPPEIAGVEVRSAFHELLPPATEFAVPVAITRRIPLADLDLDATDALPLLVLALRSADGRWEWLSDQVIRTDPGSIVVSGAASRTGLIFAFGGRASTDFAFDATAAVSIGSTIRLEATLSFPHDSFDPPLLGSFEPLVDTGIAVLGDADGPRNDALAQEFRCVASGSGVVGARYSVLNIGAESRLLRQIALPPARTIVEATTQLVCAPGADRTP